MDTEEFLKTVQINEWSEWYIPYKKLKESIRQRVREVESIDQISSKSPFRKLLSKKATANGARKTSTGGGAQASTPMGDARPSTDFGDAEAQPQRTPLGGLSFCRPPPIAVPEASPQMAPVMDRQGSSFTAPTPMSKKNLNMYVKVRYLASQTLAIEHIEYKAPSGTIQRRRIHELNDGSTSNGSGPSEIVSAMTSIEARTSDAPDKEPYDKPSPTIPFVASPDDGPSGPVTPDSPKRRRARSFCLGAAETNIPTPMGNAGNGKRPARPRALTSTSTNSGPAPSAALSAVNSNSFGPRLTSETSFGGAPENTFVLPPAIATNASFSLGPEEKGSSSMPRLSSGLMIEETAEDCAAQCRVEELVRALRALNRSIMADINAEVQKVAAFYTRQSQIISAAAGVCVDRAKVFNSLRRREQEDVEALFRKVVYSLNMLQQYCDQNYLIVAKLLWKLQDTSSMDIETGEGLEALPFFCAASSGPIHTLRELVEKEFTDRICAGNRSVAVERLALRNADGGYGAHTFRTVVSLGVLLGVIATLGIICVVMFAQIVDEDHLLYNSNTNSYLFGVTGTLIALSVLFPLNVIVWENFNINHIFSLHLHPLNHWSGVGLLRDHCCYLVVWLICSFGFLHAAQEELQEHHELRAARAEQQSLWALSQSRTPTPEVGNSTGVSGNATGANSTSNATTAPAGLWLSDAQLQQFVTAERVNGVDAWVWPYLIFPGCFVVWAALTYLNRSRPHWFLRILGRVLLTPFFSVEFPDFFICEQLVSLSATFFEVTFLWCIFHSDGVGGSCDSARGNHIFPLLILPSVWRVLQSLRRYHDEPHSRSFYPHLLNALKYFISILKFTAFALKGMADHADIDDSRKTAAIVMYLILSVIDMFFKNWYELYIEFGVFRKGSKNFLLRDELLLPRWSYYAAILNNIVIRVMWVIKYLVASEWSKDAEWVFPVFALLEIWRRFVWNIFRVENDQVDNTENYKLVKMAPLLMQQRSRAAWEVNSEDVEDQFCRGDRVGAEVAWAFMFDTTTYFRKLTREERIQVLAAGLPDFQDSPAFQQVAEESASPAGSPQVRGLEPHRKPNPYSIDGSLNGSSGQWSAGIDEPSAESGEYPVELMPVHRTHSRCIRRMIDTEDVNTHKKNTTRRIFLSLRPEQRVLCFLYRLKDDTAVDYIKLHQLPDPFGDRDAKQSGGPDEIHQYASLALSGRLSVSTTAEPTPVNDPYDEPDTPQLMPGNGTTFGDEDSAAANRPLRRLPARRGAPAAQGVFGESSIDGSTENVPSPLLRPRRGTQAPNSFGLEDSSQPKESSAN